MPFLLSIFGFFRTYLMGFVLLAAISATWKVQDWRYAGQEEKYLKKEQALVQAEADKQAKAATNFEKKLQNTETFYNDIITKLHKAKPNPTLCFDPNKLRDLNSAITRKTADPG